VTEAWQEIAHRVETGCAAAGLDLVHPFDLAECAWAELSRALPEARPARASGLAFLVGNTRRLWSPFIEACRTDARLAREPNPLDRYVEQQLTAVASALSMPSRLIFAHVTRPAPFPIQRLAEQVGLAWLSPSHLAVHPTHGPWLALRAVLLVDTEGPPRAGGRGVSPCRGCPAPCVPALERALAVSGTPLDAAAIAGHAQDWIAVRDACPVGRASRYGDAQLDYHYRPLPAKLVQGS